MINVVKIKPAFTDDRGSIFDVVEDNVGHTGIIEIRRGAIRGKHYHKRSTQYTFLVSGKMEFFEKDLIHKNSKIESVVLEPFDLVITPPMKAHAMKGLEDSVFLDMTTESRSGKGYEEDTVRLEMEI